MKTSHKAVGIALTLLMISAVFGGCGKGKYGYYEVPEKTYEAGHEFEQGWSNHNNGYEKDGPEVERLTSVKPGANQLEYLEMEYYNFIHFGMNTMTGREWGKGTESPSDFNPEKLDTDQWCEVLKASGSKGIIFTAKHHDGFCLWQTQTTEHSIKNSPYKNGKGDIVGELAASCQKYGLKLGIYLSPWDMNCEVYGTNAYNDFYKAQLTELLDGRYGDIFCLWMDGADELQTVSPEAEDIGSRELLKNYKDLKFYPAEVDVSIRKGWFYHWYQRPKSLDHLLQIYYTSVGGNSSLLLNVPPDKNGLIAEKDAELLKAFGEAARASTAKEASVIKIEAGDSVTMTERPELYALCNDDRDGYTMGENEYVLDFRLESKISLGRIDLREDLRSSQRVEEFEVWIKTSDGWTLIGDSTVIGNRRILMFENAPESDHVRIVIKQSRGAPVLRSVRLYD